MSTLPIKLYDFIRVKNQECLVSGEVCETLSIVKMLSWLFSSTTPSDMCICVLLSRILTLGSKVVIIH